MTRTGWAVAAAAATAAAVLAGCSSGSTPEPASPSPTPADGVLTFGMFLPTTGPDAQLTPPMAAAISVARKEINQAGGVNGEPIRVLAADAGAGDPAAADSLVQRRADVVIGTGDSDVTLSVLDPLVAAGVMVVSPSDTAASLSLRDNRGLFWRTVAPDSFQGAVLADTVVADRSDRPTVLVQRGTYGEGLAVAFEAGLQTVGGELAGEPVSYDADAADFAAPVLQVRRSTPDGVVLIGTSESAAVIRELLDQGIGPDRKPLYLVDGNLTAQLATDLPQGVLAGTLGTLPGAEVDQGFRKRLDAADPNLDAVTYAPEAYDAVVVSALAAVAADADQGSAIAQQMVDVTTGGDACDDFAHCVRMLGDGADINYDGQSGPLDFQADGNPGQAVMGVYEFEDGQWVPMQYVEGTVPPPVVPSPSSLG